MDRGGDLRGDCMRRNVLGKISAMKWATSLGEEREVERTWNPRKPGF